MYADLIDVKGEIQLDSTLFASFHRCFLVSELLSNYNYFLKFYERRDKCRFLKNKKVERNNKGQETDLALPFKNLMDMK